MPQRVRSNSRSSRSQIAYAAYSRSSSRNVAQERPVGRGPGHDAAAPADRDRGHQPTSAMEAARSVERPAAARSREHRGRHGMASPGLATAAARPASNGPRMTPSSVTMPVMSSAGVTSKDGLRTSVSGGAMRTPRNDRTSSGLRSSIGMAAPSGRLEVDRARRRADVERDAVAGREHGQRVRPDLVGRVAVGRDPVRADEDDVHLAAGHQVTGRDVRDERVRHAGLGQLPGRQPGALQVRPGLVDPDVDGPLLVVGDLDDARAPSRTGRRRAARCCSGSGSGAARPRPTAAGPRSRTRPAGRGPRSPRRR